MVGSGGSEGAEVLGVVVGRRPLVVGLQASEAAIWGSPMGSLFVGDATGRESGPAPEPVRIRRFVSGQL